MKVEVALNAQLKSYYIGHLFTFFFSNFKECLKKLYIMQLTVPETLKCTNINLCLLYSSYKCNFKTPYLWGWMGLELWIRTARRGAKFRAAIAY